MVFDVIVKGGLVTHHDRERSEDIGILDGKIRALGALGEEQSKLVIDAAGQRILPGGIDPHTHLDAPYGGLKGGDDIHSGTLAAAYGGTTCILDFAAGEGSLSERIEGRRTYFEQQRPVVDFGLHCVYGSDGTEDAAQIHMLPNLGISSVKYYMNNLEAESDGRLMELMESCAETGICICLHAENESLVHHFTKKLRQSGDTDYRFFPYARPPVCEAEAVERTIRIAGHAGASIYLMHITTEEAVQLIARRQRHSRKIYGETCLHYLCLTDDCYVRENGELFSVVPPLRKEKDVRALWNALKKGILHCCGSDHVSYTINEKHSKSERDASGNMKEEFDQLPGGLPGIELRLPTLINGVRQGLLSWTELVQINSYNPARIFGLKHKGEIACGSDADLVILQEDKSLTVQRAQDLHMQCDYTPYAGMQYGCLPHLVMLRGNVVIENGAWTGAANGRFARCEEIGNGSKNGKGNQLWSP